MINMEDQIIKKLEEHGKRFDEIDKRFDVVDKRFDNQDLKFANLQGQIFDIKDEIKEVKETMATKDDISLIISKIDNFVGKHEKQEQEMTFMGHKVNTLEEDVAQIKPLVGLN